MSINYNVELPDQGDNIIRTKDRDVSPNPLGFGYELYINLKKYGDATAQIDAETGETDTFAQLHKRCVQVALQLRKRGVTPEDIIAPCTRNHLNTAVAVVAPLLIGAKVACMNPFATTDETIATIDMVKPKVLFVCEEEEVKIENSLKELGLNSEIVVFGKTERNTPFEEMLVSCSRQEEENFEPTKAADIYATTVIIFTSGSTGIPKGTCINHYSMLCQLEKYVNYRKERNDTDSISVTYGNITWISGLITLAINILNGSPRLVCSEFEEEKTWTYVVKYKAASILLTMQNAVALIKRGNPNKIATPNLKSIIIAGARISPANITALQRLFTHPLLVMNMYGMSEVVALVFSFDDLSVFMKKPGCVGTPLRGFWYKIVHPETGRICGPNEVGELCLKTKFCMVGYYNQDSTEFYDKDGFFKTGDRAYYDQDHCFFIIDRISDVLRYNSQWVSATTLECLLVEHPAVQNACVIGIPTSTGDVATGVVVKSPTATDVTEEELIHFVNEKVDDFHKLRGGIIFVNEHDIPYTVSGKLKRCLLRKQILENFNHLDNMNIYIQ